MPELIFFFQSEERDPESPIKVRLTRTDTGNYTGDMPFVPPLGEAELGELRWYLETFSKWPSGPDYERAEKMKLKLEAWGRALLDSVLTGGESPRIWQQFVGERDPHSASIVTIDSIEPRVLQLPWELLADEGGHIFAQGISVRRRLKKLTSSPQSPLALPVRVLLVASRPDDAGYYDHRSEALPLLDALEPLGEQVAVEFLSPPSLRALSDRLVNPGLPPVHILHFDGHGQYDTALKQGYLLFEDDEHKQDKVDASQLGTLLAQRGVPLVVLSACESSMQAGEANPYATLAARLILSGVGSVLAMSYTVQVSAARKFTEAFYRSLVGGRTVGQAVEAGRFKLLSDEKRHTLTRRDARGRLQEEVIRLRDWFIPALYQQSGDPAIFRPGGGLAEPRPRPRALEDARSPGGLPPEPLYGFHGRSRELLKIERLLNKKNIVVLHGFGGAGKTALAAEAARWLYRTGRFPGGAAFISFEGGGSRQQLCSWVGQAVSGDPNFVIGEGDPVERIAALLRQRPALVILDNFESVLGEKPLMPEEELRDVLEAVWRWSQSASSRILITTRDTRFNDSRFGRTKHTAHLELEGLSDPDAMDMAAALLDDLGIDRSRIERESLQDLLRRLGGHPLSLQLVLPHLKQHSPEQLSAQFEALLPGFKSGAAAARNESLEVSLRFSLDRLGEATRVALPALAVFQGACFEDDMLEITAIDPELWQAARAELEAAALVRVENVPGVKPPFLRFHPTLLPYLGRELRAEQRATLEERYWKRYYSLANYLYREDNEKPHFARAIALLDMPNLLHACELAVRAGESDPEAAAAAVDFAERIGRFLDAFGRRRERQRLLGQLERLGVGGGERALLTKAEYLLRSQQGEALLAQGRAAEAEALFRELLRRLEAGAAYDGAYDHTITLWSIGGCLKAQGRITAALELYEQARDGFTRLASDDRDARLMFGRVYTDLGDCLTDLGRYGDAEQAYQDGLAISRELEDHRAVGVNLGQQGTLALLRRRYDEARRSHQEALETFRRLGEPQSEAVAWHQLGMVAQEQRDWDEAERCYREGLRICEMLNIPDEIAASCNQLAMVAESAGRPEEAERWYLRALALHEQTGRRSGAASIASNLADLYLSLDRLEEAEQYARKALAIKETLDASAEPWKTYNILAQIAAARNQPEQAAAWRRKEQESYAAYAGSSEDVQKWAGAIEVIVLACQGRDDARQFAGQIVEKYTDSESRGNLAAAFRRILDGERDQESLLAGLDRVDAAVIKTTLQRLAGEIPPLVDLNAPGPDQPSRQEQIQGHLEKWSPVLDTLRDACRGVPEARQAIEKLVVDMKDNDSWRGLTAAMGRILEGERDLAALAAGLDDIDTAILQAALQRLDGAGEQSPPDAPPAPAAQPDQPAPDSNAALLNDQPAPAEQADLTMEQLQAILRQGLLPQATAEEKGLASALAQEMQSHPNAPDEYRRLGGVLLQMLDGERQPDLASLPEELADFVRRLAGG